MTSSKNILFFKNFINMGLNNALKVNPMKSCDIFHTKKLPIEKWRNCDFYYNVQFIYYELATCNFFDNFRTWNFSFFIPILVFFYIGKLIMQRTMQRKYHFCIPFLGIMRPLSKFPHSWVCEQFIYSQDRSTYFLQQNRQLNRGNV